jgi:hypothetical protein
MAKIQNPCDQYGNPLATLEHVTKVTDDIKAGLTYTFVGNENRAPGFIGNDYISFTFERDSEINNGFNSTVTIKPIESLESLNNTEDLSYTLATGPLVKEVKDKLEDDIKKAKLTIGGKNVKTNIDELVRDINKDDIINNEDIENGITYKGILQTNGLNFRGDHVIIVENKDGKTVDLWFGPNNNPGFATKLDESGFTGNKFYIFNDASSPQKYFLHPSGPFSAGTENIAVPNNDIEKIVLKNKNDGTELNFADSDSTLKCIIKRVDADNTITEEEIETLPINENNATNGTMTYTSGGVSFEITDIVKNTDADAEKGLTPGFVRYKATIKLHNGTIMPNGGIYRVEIQAANSTVATHTKELFVYKHTDDKAPSVGSVNAVYRSIANRTISGLTYDTDGEIELTINDITNTQQMVSNLKHINVKDVGVNGISTVTSNPALLRKGSNGLETTPNTTVVGNENDNNAVFTYTQTYNITGNEILQPSGKFQVTPYYIKNKITALGDTATEGTVVSEDGEKHYLWTSFKLEDGITEASFDNEKDRICGELVNGKLVILEETYDSTKSIGTDAEANYANQALVQYGKLRHPSKIKETDGRATHYVNTVGTKYFVKKIKWTNEIASEKQQVPAFNIKVDSGIIGLGNSSSPVKFYAADVETLEAVRIDATEANGGRAAAGSFKNGSWDVSIPEAIFKIYRDTGFYLIIEMNKNAQNIGVVTIK